MSRQKILLVAYQCGPGMGSVSEIGWQWYAGLCREHDVTLVTHARNHDALRDAGAPLARSEIIEIDTEWFAGPLYRCAKRLFPWSEHSVFLISSLDYFLFDRCAYTLLRRRLAEGQRWDVLHRTTPVTLAAPTWLGRLGLPTILGPLNSGLTDPPGFAAVLRRESTGLVRLRGLSRFLDLLIGSSRRAACILVATRATRRNIPDRYQDRCVTMSENGVLLERFKATPWPLPPGPQQPLRVLFVGRLIPAKALPLLLRALARLHQEGRRAELAVLGDGPLRQTWEAEAAQLGLTGSVTFHGAANSDDVVRALQGCHVLCLPSVRESGGAVLLEAMASARPVIAMDFGGPSELVDSEVGELVPLHSPDAAVAGLAASLRNVMEAPELWRRRGERGRQRAELAHSWAAKISEAGALYARVVCGGLPS